MEVIVARPPVGYSFDFYLKRCIYRISEKQAACVPCAVTISAEENVTNKLNQHFSKVHACGAEHKFCQRCVSQAGLDENGLNQHVNSKIHKKVRAEKLCTVCGTFDPQSSHNKSHIKNVVKLPKLNVKGAQTKVGNDDVVFALLGQTARKDSGSISFALPCAEHCHASLRAFGSVLKGIEKPGPHRCNICRLQGVGDKSGLTLVLDEKPAIFTKKDKTPKVEKSITKKQWEELPEDLQDCYTVKKGMATLNEDDYEEYLQTHQEEANDSGSEDEEPTDPELEQDGEGNDLD